MDLLVKIGSEALISGRVKDELGKYTGGHEVYERCFLEILQELRNYREPQPPVSITNYPNPEE